MTYACINIRMLLWGAKCYSAWGYWALTVVVLGLLSRIPRLYPILGLTVEINDEGSSSYDSSTISYPSCLLGVSPGRESASVSRPQLNWPISWLDKHQLLSLFYILDWTVSVQQCDIKQSWNATASAVLKKRITSQREWPQPLVRRTGEQQACSGPERAVADGVLLLICGLPDFILCTWWGLMSGSVGIAPERVISVEPTCPKCPFQSLTKPTVLQICSGSQSAAITWTIGMELLPSKYLPSLWWRLKSSNWSPKVFEDLRSLTGALPLWGASLWCHCLPDVLLHPWCEIDVGKSPQVQTVLPSQGYFNGDTASMGPFQSLMRFIGHKISGWESSDLERWIYGDSASTLFFQTFVEA